MTRLVLGEIPETYAGLLDEAALEGARFGAVVEFKGNGPEHAEVNRVFDEAMERMQWLGATVVPVRIPAMNDYRGVGTDIYEAWDLFKVWFSELGPETDLHDFQSFLAHGTYGEELLPRTYERIEHAKPEHFAAYEANLLQMHEFWRLLADFMDEHSLDAPIYPLQSISAWVILVGNDTCRRHIERSYAPVGPRGEATGKYLIGISR